MYSSAVAPRHKPPRLGRLVGPYVIAGRWWDRPVHRDYHFAETQRGDILWVYYDRSERRWFQQGRVE